MYTFPDINEHAFMLLQLSLPIVVSSDEDEHALYELQALEPIAVTPEMELQAWSLRQELFDMFEWPVAYSHADVPLHAS